MATLAQNFSIMMTRRNFIKNATVLTTGVAVTPLDELILELKRVKKLGIQLFSLPKSLDKDFEGTIALLAKMGYQELELFGPYPCSAPVAHERWKALGGRLGFSGSGYFGKSIQEVKAILKRYNLTAPSAHTDWDTLVNHMPQLGEAARFLGHKYVVLPAIPEEKRKTADDYKRVAATFHQIAENAQKEGITFAYHNHGYGLKTASNTAQPLLFSLLDSPEVAKVGLQMDVFWTAAGGVKPIDLLKKYPKKYVSMHLKDMKESKVFSGDGGSAPQWMELFPYMTTAGDGVLDVKGIVQQALANGVKHFFVEQDLVAQPEIALKQSFDYLRKLA
jgi:sugar phosphate isomerase/epimerase